MRQCVCWIRWSGDRLACGWSLGVQSAFFGRVAGFSCATPEAEASASALWPRTHCDWPWEYSVACLCVTLAGSFPPWACASAKCVVGGERLGFMRPLGFSKRVSSLLQVSVVDSGSKFYKERTWGSDPSLLLSWGRELVFTSQSLGCGFLPSEAGDRLNSFSPVGRNCIKAG